MIEDRFAMPPESQSAIHEGAATLRRQEINRFSKQHGAMGRAYAPQRRSHHHRPVISFKELSNPSDEL
jgi:hypothetical protein